MSRPRRLWWSFLWTLRCSVSWLIDAVRMAIWTSAEPVSLGPRPYLVDRSDFCSLVRGTGYVELLSTRASADSVGPRRRPTDHIKSSEPRQSERDAYRAGSSCVSASAAV